MKFRGITKSHGGNVRTNNEDNAYINGHYRRDDSCFSWEYDDSRRKRFLAAVFDGMGGEDNGEVASRLAAEELDNISDKLFSENVDEYICAANKAIVAHQQANNMGSTCVILSIEDNVYYFSNLGDSRGYLLRDGQLKKMTRDHNMVQELLNNGILTKEQAESHPDRHSLSQYLGMREGDEEILPEAYNAEPLCAERRDICLLCSDGLTDMLSEEEIEDILKRDQKLTEKADTLVNTALQNGGKDNVTIVVVEAV